MRGRITMEPSDVVLRGLLAAAPDALIVVDIEDVIVFANDQAERLFGWSKIEMLGLPVTRLVPDRLDLPHPDLRGTHSPPPTTRPTGAGLDLRAVRRDGSQFAADISVSTFPTPEGPLVGIAIRDASEAHRTEQLYRAVLASAPDATLGVSASGRIELVN